MELGNILELIQLNFRAYKYDELHLTTIKRNSLLIDIS